MIKQYRYNSLDGAREILKRPVVDISGLIPLAGEIFDKVRREGDRAVREFTLKFDGTDVEDSLVKDDEFENAEDLVGNDLKSAIDMAISNIKLFHERQAVKFPIVEIVPGVNCWQKQVPIDRIGLYIPGGTAPLFSTVLMLAIPASVAGCNEMVLCTPPRTDGTIDPAILYAARKAGAKVVHRIGGIQAIAAMAFGTERILPVDKIFGPGNQYVTAAKQLASAYGIAIDLPAGPSEVMVVADESANPVFVAADLLSQAEHGTDSQVILVTGSAKMADMVLKELKLQLSNLPRREIAEQSLEHSVILSGVSRIEMAAIINDYAPEHLILAVDDPGQIAASVKNAGSVFLGNYTPESAGDYASGTNHTLPTNGFAKGWSGVTLDSFMKKISFQEISGSGLTKLGNTIMTMARAELLEGHARAVELRINTLSNGKY